MAGGRDAAGYWKQTMKITREAKVEHLKEMPVAKGLFPLVLWKEGKTMISIGGWNGENLDEVRGYSLRADRWSAIECLPFPTHNSAAIILENN